jgi:hypothetical protein
VQTQKTCSFGSNHRGHEHVRQSSSTVNLFLLRKW